MKKTILSVMIALSSIMAINAQHYYIGGSLGISSSSWKIDNIDNKARLSYSFSIAPEIGYNINEKTAVGLSVSAAISSSKTSFMGMDINGNLRAGGLNESNGKNLKIAPYLRYSIFKWRKFDLLGMASVYVNTSKTKSSYVYNYSYVDESGQDDYYTESISGTKIFTLGVNIHPVLQYNLSNRILLLAHLNFFHLDFWKEKQKVIYNFEADEFAITTPGFNLGLDTNNILPAIGFIYKF